MYKKLMIYYEYCETPLPGDVMRGLEEALFSEVRELIAKRYPGADEKEIERIFNIWKDTPRDYYELSDATEKFNQVIADYINDDKWNKYRNKNPIDVIINSLYDITTPEILNQKELFDKAMELPSTSANIPNKYLSFFFEVVKNGPADLKRDPNWTNRSTHLYNGEVLTADDFGNILYGWLSNFLYIPEWLSKELMANLAQLVTTLTWDAPRDQYMIQKGFDLYDSLEWKNLDD